MQLHSNSLLREQIKKPMKFPNVQAFKEVFLYDEYMLTQDIVIHYMSICTPDLNNNQTKTNRVYSALIILNENGTDTETKFIYDIARTQEKANRMMVLLSRNGVTPNNALDIINEIL